MTEVQLKNMLLELSLYKRDKNYLKSYYIKKRLDQNLVQYHKKLQQSIEFLQQRDNKKVLKRLNQVDNNDK